MKKYILKSIIFIVMIFYISSFSYALIIPKSSNNYDHDSDIHLIEKNIYDYHIEKDGLISKDVEIGDEVIYGKYDEPIIWDVLDKNDDKVLLISKYILVTLPYNKTWNPISWEKCTLRNWLNNEFYNDAFDENEKKFIIETYNINHDNHLYKVKGCDDTLDKVFILSSDEARKYYKSNEKMKAVGTDTCNINGLWISNSGITKGYSVWWLRTPGRYNTYASLVHAGGSVGDIGDGVATTGNGVRPCIWVSIM